MARTNQVASEVRGLPWTEAHARAEALWQRLGEPVAQGEGEPQPPSGAAFEALALGLATARLKAAGLPVVTWVARGRRMVVARLKARRPAFDPRQRQALVVSVALDGARPYPPVHPSRLEAHEAERLATADGGDTLARGGLLLSHAVTAVELLARANLPTARDLLVVLEHRVAGAARPLPGATAVPADEGRALLDAAACVVAEAGAVPLQIDDDVVLLVPVAQKGAVWLRLRASGRAVDPGLPMPSGATNVLLDALHRLRHAERPLRVSDAAKAQLLGVAEGQGLTGSLHARALLNPATATQTLRRSGHREPHLDALLHDTWTVTRVVTAGRPDAALDDAWALLDCRVVPGRDTAALLAELAEIAGPEVSLEVLAERPSKASDLHGQLLRVLRETVARRVPKARMVPSLQLLGCDAWGWRQSAVPCYGFAPVQLPASVDFEALWHRGGVATTPAERAWGRSVFVEALACYLVEA